MVSCVFQVSAQFLRGLCALIDLVDKSWSQVTSLPAAGSTSALVFTVHGVQHVCWSLNIFIVRVLQRGQVLSIFCINAQWPSFLLPAECYVGLTRNETSDKVKFVYLVHTKTLYKKAPRTVLISIFIRFRHAHKTNMLHQRPSKHYAPEIMLYSHLLIGPRSGAARQVRVCVFPISRTHA